jgi:hypothetical protein
LSGKEAGPVSFQCDLPNANMAGDFGRTVFAAQLAEGIDGLDPGCGRGNALAALARRFPPADSPVSVSR